MDPQYDYHPVQIFYVSEFKHPRAGIARFQALAALKPVQLLIILPQEVCANRPQSRGEVRVIQQGFEMLDLLQSRCFRVAWLFD
jgi:hypothetical protein